MKYLSASIIALAGCIIIQPFAFDRYKVSRTQDVASLCMSSSAADLVSKIVKGQMVDQLEAMARVYKTDKFDRNYVSSQLSIEVELPNTKEADIYLSRADCIANFKSTFKGNSENIGASFDVVIDKDGGLIARTSRTYAVQLVNQMLEKK